ncbi:glycosyltransferase family 2 protein [Citrobacter portucalensis]|uniref:Glycosyltransferase family 2 protein n=1 Tax=Citrobacter portucalensis TaxID=1639133 RepID=A0A9X4GMB5_9ENTR|nr:glycosyltransferase family 2 protein [Citrobacter portucalensis]MDE9618743.1 glycosyltransferase family 2 protein [Citrobacter portucalensis]
MVNASGYLLSIIIPTYNNAELITATLASIHQSITDDVEVIIVNDGSTDLTEERINAFYREKDCHNVKYINHKNQGVAITRNVGLAHATGKYIGFVDSDDIVCPDYFTVLLPKLRAEKYDIIEFNLTRDINNLYKDTHEIENNISQREIILSDDNYAPLLPIFKAGQWHLMTKIFHRNIIGSDKFEEHRRYEDMIFCPFQYFKCHKILKIENKLYYYRINDNSITENIIDSDADSIFFAMRKMYKYINKNSAKRTVATFMIINCFLEGRKLLRKKKGYYRYSESMINDIQNALACCDTKIVKKKIILKMKYPHIDRSISETRYKILSACKSLFLRKGF